MSDELGTVIFEGKMYNLDKMNSEELKSLILKMEKNYQKLEKQAEILAGNYSQEEVNKNE